MSILKARPPTPIAQSNTAGVIVDSTVIGTGAVLVAGVAVIAKNLPASVKFVRLVDVDGVVVV
jgi:hypothetical protein